MKSKLLTLALALATSALTAAPPDHPTVAIPVVPGTSSPMQVVPVQPATPANSFFYDYTVTDGGSLTDTIPVQITLAGSTGTWSSVSVHFNDPAGDVPGVTVPADTTVMPGFTTTTVYVNLNTGAFSLGDPTVAETFNATINIQSKDKNPNTLSVTNASEFPNIHIRVTVKPAENDTAFFMTDSSGNLLTDCAGAFVTKSGSDGGRFAINVNPRKNIEVSTNPGQFYFNVLWTNHTGVDQVVTVSFARTNCVPQGANAIHAYAFPPAFSGVSQDTFNAVNNGIPGGVDDVIENILVPAGWTLWANEHLEWYGTGLPAPADIASTCDTANQVLSVTGTLSGGVSRTGSAGAKGYKK